MERIVKHITKRLVDLLPKNREYYKLGDLQKAGFPKFVVRRIEVELERNLSESIVLPETEWADMESDTVREVWEQFVSAIRSQSRLPQSYATAVVETAIGDILDILVQPRKNLPDIIFGADDTLEYEELSNRVEVVVVYRHFASLLPRYMEKRGYSELSKEQCQNLITQADEKLTAHYTPLNWAQMLEPLFILMVEQIDSNLLRLFFEDKNMPRLARRFDMMNKSLNRSELIEELSSPDLPDDDEQNDLFAANQPTITTGWMGMVKPAENEDEEVKEEADLSQSASELEIEKPEDQTDQALHTLYSDSDQELEKSPEDESDEEGALNDMFFESEDEAEREEQEDSDPGLTEGEPADKEDLYEHEDEPDEVEDISSGSVNEAEPQAEQEEGRPMWQRFMSEEEKEEMERLNDENVAGEDLDKSESEKWDGLEQEEDQPPEEEEFDEDPIIDLTKDDEPIEEEYNRLFRMLEDDRDRFVDEIFRGAAEAYEEAVKEISTKDDWRSASRYVEKEVFKRNLVDMYSEAAVDFTDRLQSYFMEITKSN